MEQMGNFLFGNIGKTLKNFAIAAFVIETIAGIIAAFAMLDGTEGFSLLLIPAAPFVAYISSMFLYGFGELVENSSITANENLKNNSTVNKDELPDL